MHNLTPSRYDRLSGALSLRQWRVFYERQKIRSNTNYSVLFMDIDHTKNINDCFGLQVGDLVIRHVASTLLYKVSWKPHPVWRIGGDEFLIFMRGLNIEGANQWAQAMQENLKPFKLSNDTPITMTIGLASSYTIASWERVVLAADNANHRGKHEGRNRIVIANTSDYEFPIP